MFKLEGSEEIVGPEVENREFLLNFNSTEIHRIEHRHAERNKLLESIEFNQGEFILVVDMANGGIVYSSELESLDSKLRQQFFLAQTGQNEVEKDEYQTATLRYAIGFLPEQNNDHFNSVRLVEPVEPERDNYFLPSPEQMDKCVGIVFSGSAVYLEDEPHSFNKLMIERVKNLIFAGHNRKIPMLGICFGSQILNNVVGGHEVDWVREDRAMGESGVIELEKTEVGEHHPIVAGLPNTFPIMQYHSQHVIPGKEPNGMKVLAKSNDSEVQIAVYEDERSILTLQGHPEVSSVTAAIMEYTNSKNGSLDRQSKVFSADLGYTTHVVFCSYLEMVKKYVNSRAK